MRFVRTINSVFYRHYIEQPLAFYGQYLIKFLMAVNNILSVYAYNMANKSIKLPKRRRRKVEAIEAESTNRFSLLLGNKFMVIAILNIFNVEVQWNLPCITILWFQ